MGLLEDLGDESKFPDIRRAWCSVCSLLKTLPPKESQALKLRMDNARISHMSISAVLTDNGYPISDSTVGRHRRSRCTGVAR
jgi:hypothetical protein